MLLVNLGTPDATDYWSMRRYLKEFLSDRRVIETPRWLWWPILNLIILTVRPGAKGQDYDIDLEQGARRGAAEDHHPRRRRRSWRPASRPWTARIVVDWAMRYGNPSIAVAHRARCRSQGCDRILLVPLYPQYCAATTATVCDKAFDALKTMRWQPALRVAPPYHDDPVYIDALADSVARRARPSSTSSRR